MSLVALFVVAVAVGAVVGSLRSRQGLAYFVGGVVVVSAALVLSNPFSNFDENMLGFFSATMLYLATSEIVKSMRKSQAAKPRTV